MRVVYKDGHILLVQKEYSEIHMRDIDVETIIDAATAKRLAKELTDAANASESGARERS
ncbi:MAG: hypothetical protein M0036_00110 [Desulfobacteraceae bacterium]|nr:hypothetical protein [Desulfobacteraceae bacterium]